ncbi:MAG: hypothetical protein ACYCSN_09035 [Acidobacteriaceae bacterium]
MAQQSGSSHNSPSREARMKGGPNSHKGSSGSSASASSQKSSAGHNAPSHEASAKVEKQPRSGGTTSH